MAKPGFSWLTPVLCVTDLSKSLRHYETVLGFEISWQWSEGAAFDEASKPTFACVARGECSLFLCENGQGQAGSWICLNVCNPTELDQIFEEYQKNAADIVEAPVDCPWGMREMQVRDIDKNVFRIGCPME